MAEILSAETLKATKVGKIKKAKEIINELIAAEKDQTKTSKPNRAKLTKWENAKKAYEQTETKARALHTKITNDHPNLLNGKDVLNFTINEMQAALATLEPEKRNAILNESGINEIQDVKLGNDLFEKGGALSNLGGDFLKGGDKSVAVSKAFTGVAIASFAASGVASVFKAATGKALTGALLKDGAMTALKFLGEKVLLPIWNFNPVGTALIAAVVAMKVIPVIARFVNKIKNKYASLTRANTMKNRLAELAEQDGPNVEFENSEFKQGNGEPGKGGSTYTPGGSSIKDPAQPGGSNTGKPQSLRERLGNAQTKKERDAIFASATLEEYAQYCQENIDESEKEILGIERAVNSLASQYSSAEKSRQKTIEADLKKHSEKAGKELDSAEIALKELDKLLKFAASNDTIHNAQSSAAQKLTSLRAKVAAIKTACKDKTAVKDPAAKDSKKPGTERSLADSVKIYLTTCTAFDTFRKNNPGFMLNDEKTFDDARKTYVATALKNNGFELTPEELDYVYSQVSEIFKLSEKEEAELDTTIKANELAANNEIDYLNKAPEVLEKFFAESPVNVIEIEKVLAIIDEKCNSLSVLSANVSFSEEYQEKIKTAIDGGKTTSSAYRQKLAEAKKETPQTKTGDDIKQELEEILTNMKSSYEKLVSIKTQKEAEGLYLAIKEFNKQITEKAGDNPKYSTIVETANNTLIAAEDSFGKKPMTAEQTSDENSPKKPSGVASNYIRQFANGNFVKGKGFVSNHKAQQGLSSAQQLFDKIKTGTYTPTRFGELSAEDREFLSAFGDKVLAEAQRVIDSNGKDTPGNLSRKDASKEALKQQGLSEEEIAAIIGKQ